MMVEFCAVQPVILKLKARFHILRCISETSAPSAINVTFARWITSKNCRACRACRTAGLAVSLLAWISSCQVCPNQRSLERKATLLHHPDPQPKSQSLLIQHLLSHFGKLATWSGREEENSICWTIPRHSLQ